MNLKASVHPHLSSLSIQSPRSLTSLCYVEYSDNKSNTVQPVDRTTKPLAICVHWTGLCAAEKYTIILLIENKFEVHVNCSIEGVVLHIH